MGIAGSAFGSALGEILKDFTSDLKFCITSGYVIPQSIVTTNFGAIEVYLNQTNPKIYSINHKNDIYDINENEPGSRIDILVHRY